AGKVTRIEMLFGKAGLLAGFVLDLPLFVEGRVPRATTSTHAENEEAIRSYRRVKPRQRRRALACVSAMIENTRGS
ncbi:MAG: hypothetical protein ABR569_13015, partial [Gaiellaceae bacterium]